MLRSRGVRRSAMRSQTSSAVARSWRVACGPVAAPARRPSLELRWPTERWRFPLAQLGGVFGQPPGSGSWPPPEAVERFELVATAAGIGNELVRLNDPAVVVRISALPSSVCCAPSRADDALSAHEWPASQKDGKYVKPRGPKGREQANVDIYEIAIRVRLSSCYIKSG